MNKNFFLLIVCAIALSIQSCKKSDSPSTVVGTACDTLPIRLGSKTVFTRTSGGTQTNIYNLQTTYGGINYFGNTVATPYGNVASYVGQDSKGNVYQYLPATGDLPTANMILFKPNQAVGASWSYSFNSVQSPTSVVYKYTFKVLKNGIIFMFGGKPYTDCTQIQLTFQTFYSGTLFGTQTTGLTYACGLGTVEQYVDGSLSSTLTSYKY